MCTIIPLSYVTLPSIGVRGHISSSTCRCGRSGIPARTCKWLAIRDSSSVHLCGCHPSRNVIPTVHKSLPNCIGQIRTYLCCGLGFISKVLHNTLFFVRRVPIAESAITMGSVFIEVYPWFHDLSARTMLHCKPNQPITSQFLLLPIRR